MFFKSSLIRHGGKGVFKEFNPQLIYEKKKIIRTIKLSVLEGRRRLYRQTTKKKTLSISL